MPQQRLTAWAVVEVATGALVSLHENEHDAAHARFCTSNGKAQDDKYKVVELTNIS